MKLNYQLTSVLFITITVAVSCLQNENDNLHHSSISGKSNNNIHERSIRSLSFYSPNSRKSSDYRKIATNGESDHFHLNQNDYDDDEDDDDDSGEMTYNPKLNLSPEEVRHLLAKRQKRMFGSIPVPPYQWGLLSQSPVIHTTDEEMTDKESIGKEIEEEQRKRKRAILKKNKSASLFRERQHNIDNIEKENKRKRFARKKCVSCGMKEVVDWQDPWYNYEDLYTDIDADGSDDAANVDWMPYVEDNYVNRKRLLPLRRRRINKKSRQEPIGMRDLLSVGKALDFDKAPSTWKTGGTSIDHILDDKPGGLDPDSIRTVLQRISEQLERRKKNYDPWYPAIEEDKRRYIKEAKLEDDGYGDNFYGDPRERFAISKRSGKSATKIIASEKNDKDVMNTLEKILADDDSVNTSVKNNTNSVSNMTNTPPAVTKEVETAKQINNNSNAKNTPLIRKKKAWDEYFGFDKRSADAKRKENATIVPLKRKRVLDNELVRMYFKSIARAMSSKKRKRGVSSPPPTADKSHALKIGTELKKLDEVADQHSPANTDEKLRNIENAILDQATEILQSSDNPGEDLEDASRQVLNRLDVAYSLEKLRQSLEEFEFSLTKMREEDAPVTQEGNMGRDNTKKIKKVAKKTNSPAHNKATDQEYLVPSTIDVGKDDQDGEDENGCPVLQKVLRYCNNLIDDVGDPERTLTSPCVSFVVCAACGDETTLPTCGKHFLQSATVICQDNFRCQVAAGAIRSVVLTDFSRLEMNRGNMCPQRSCLVKYAALGYRKR